MNYKFSNLLAAPYRGGNLVIRDNDLLTPVGNRVGQISLTQSTSHTLPFENQKQIRTLCVSSDGVLLLSVDEDGRALLINRKLRALLHHFSFKAPVSCARFSPNGLHLAVGVGRLVQVWETPSLGKQLSPMQLHRTYGQCHSDVLDVNWSPDSQFLAVASKDITVRVFSLSPIQGYEPPTLAGHKDSITGVFFTSSTFLQKAQVAGVERPAMYSLSSDGALHAWTYTASAANALDNVAPPVAKRLRREQQQAPAEASELSEPQSRGAPDFPHLSGGKWYLTQKHYFNQRGARVSCYDFHAQSGMLVVGFTNGIFDLYQLPDFQSIHTLSISRERISAISFNDTGDWIAVGCAKLGQLLVWEWRSETYVIKQQGHYHDITTAAFSPDGALIATGADDMKVKIFQQSTGFCYVTFSEHSAPVTAVQFLPSGHALVSAGLDGTVRAYDLIRYRNFRTLTSPTPVQFGSLSVDPSGEIVCAGTVDTFQIFLWSLKTGRLLDVLAGHEGPVSGLAFSPGTPLLASSSWDRTVRTWDVFNGSAAVDLLQHNHDVLTLAYRPDGKQLAAATLDGQIYLWDPLEAVLQGTIEGRRDIKGGRLASDRRAAGNLASGAAFTSLAYSADGSFLIAGGNSKFICIYDVTERVMLRRFQISSNQSLDGVLDVLNSRSMTDAGPLQLIDHHDKGDEVELLPPTLDATAAADVPGTANQRRPVLRTRCVCLSPTGRSWGAATTEGLLLYSLDDGLVFDPTDLTEDLTPAACLAAVHAKAFVRAILIALRLRDAELLRHCIFTTPQSQVPVVCSTLPASYVPQVLTYLAEYLGSSPHLEFVLCWVKAMCTVHGDTLKLPISTNMPALRSLQKVLNKTHVDLATACEGNLYGLQYLTHEFVSSL